MQNHTEALTQLKNNPTLFAQHFLNFEPFPYQQKLLNDQSKRIIACMARQTGKTTTIAAKAIHFAYTNPNTTTLIISPSLRQSMIMFDKIQTLTTQNQLLTKSITRKTHTIIQLTNNSRIIALPCSENLLRGYTAQQAICDEAAFIPEKTITQIIFPMLSTTNGTATFLSTPWDKNHFFYKAFLNPTYSTHKTKSNQCPLITPEFLKEMQQNMTHEAYQMEYEAEFTEAQNSYFPQTLIRKSIEQAQKQNLELHTNLEQNYPKGKYYAGIDFGKLQDHSAIAIVKIEDNTIKLFYMHEFPLETPYTQVIGHLTKANTKLHLQKILVDQTGVGEPILEEIRNQGINSTEGTKFTPETKEQLLTGLKITMEQEKLAIPYERRLCEQINDQQYAYNKNGHLQFSHPPNSKDDMLWALALAVAASKTEPAPKLWIVSKMSKGKTKLQQLRTKLLKHQTTSVTR
jgi:phage FluMu gp28-like protein